jgi:chitinase
LRSEIFLRCICDTSVRYINYALILENKKILEKVQPDLKFLKDRYFSLGGTNNLLVAAFSQMQSFITPLINNLDIVAELDSYFEYVIFSLVNQGHDAILKKQHQGLAKLRQEWLAEDTEDPDEQEETWSYLRDALNNGTLSHRPIPA